MNFRVRAARGVLVNGAYLVGLNFLNLIKGFLAAGLLIRYLHGPDKLAIYFGALFFLLFLFPPTWALIFGLIDEDNRGCAVVGALIVIPIVVWLTWHTFLRFAMSNRQLPPGARSQVTSLLN